MITWIDINPHDAISEPAAFEIRMDNGGNHYHLILQGYSTIATCSSKETAKASAEIFLDAIAKMPDMNRPSPTPTPRPSLRVVE